MGQQVKSDRYAIGVERGKDAERAPLIKSFQGNCARLAFFNQQQPRNQEPAEHEENQHAETPGNEIESAMQPDHK